MHSPGSASTPSHAGLRSRALRLLAGATGASSEGSWDAMAADADELRYPATLFVWGRWLVLFACVFLLMYRPDFILFKYVAYMLFLALLAGLNGYVHYGLRSGRTVTLRWMLTLSATDVVLITAGMVVGGGFGNYFFYLLYYPALAAFAVFFSSYRLVLAPDIFDKDKKQVSLMYDPMRRIYEDMPALKYKVELNETARTHLQADSESWRGFCP